MRPQSGYHSRLLHLITSEEMGVHSDIHYRVPGIVPDLFHHYPAIHSDRDTFPARLLEILLQRTVKAGLLDKYGYGCISSVDSLSEPLSGLDHNPDTGFRGIHAISLPRMQLCLPCYNWRFSSDPVSFRSLPAGNVFW